ncbi:uncharacterized protein ATC70_000630 [Mucor velutinosus]|uniref:Uncharacterized protein n=1 Tax=Mucor velutinosus TaxID=708070 RepID=A0AAN7I1P2_9FUNG|nr:hypothetical protein ATC70_000630 [Mucor velutinosus]
MFPLLSVLQLIKLPHGGNPDPYTADDQNAIKITAAILGISCGLIAIVMSIFMYQHYLRRQYLTLSENQSIHKRPASLVAQLITAEAQREEQTADIEANSEGPPSPVMQQGLLQKELVKNYGSYSQPHTTTFLKPPPHHS